MKIKTLIFLLISFYTFNSIAQSSFIVKLPVQGEPIKMIKTFDGGYAIIAQVYHNTEKPIETSVFFKYDKYGALSYQISLTDLEDTITVKCYDLIQVESGDFLICGQLRICFL